MSPKNHFERSYSHITGSSVVYFSIKKNSIQVVADLPFLADNTAQDHCLEKIQKDFFCVESKNPQKSKNTFFG